MTVSIDFLNFNDRDHQTIFARTPNETGKKLGRSLSVVTKKLLKEKRADFEKPKYRDECTRMLISIKKLARQDIFTLKKVNYLSRYFQTLDGFCTGAGISLLEGVFLQSFVDSGCQSILVQDTAKHLVNIVHTEENSEDKELVKLHKHLDEFEYRYKVVHMNTPTATSIFFAYPGLCAAGPAFGINQTHQTVLAADTLMPITQSDHHDIWANAVISMLFDAGIIAIMEKILSVLTSSHLNVFGGYAVHAVSFDDKPTMASWEFGANQSVRQPLVKIGTRCSISQTNYSLNPSMRRIDAYENPKKPADIKFSNLIRRRTNELCDIAKNDIVPTKNTKRDIKNLLTVIASPVGVDEDSGFPSVYEAGYMVGAFSPQSAHITIGKLSPPPIPGNPYSLNTHSLSVAVVYSLPSRRSLLTPFGATDEDTSFVADKVMEALKKKRMKARLYPISEDTIDRIAKIRADCIVNLIDWTGLDASLKKQAYAQLRAINTPITGGSEKNILQTENKLTMKKALDRWHLPTAVWQSFTTESEHIHTDFNYPVIIKPALEHCSVGLGYDSLAHNEKELRRIIRKQIATFAQPALAEEFIEGRELLVYLLEENDMVRVLPIEEIIFGKQRAFAFQTYESKWVKNSKDYKSTRVQLASLTDEERKKIEVISKKAFRRLGFRGYARFDVRLRKGIPYLLETNANPNMYDSDDEQIPGIAFADFVQTIVKTAIYQHKKGWKI